MDKIKVIIADDSDFVRDGMRIILDVDDEFEVIGCAANGKDAIELAERHTPDVFLMDIQMPVMDGYEATKMIRQLPDPVKAGIPIIAVTANAFGEDVRKAKETGMNGHISKPVEPEELAGTLERILS